MKLTDENFQLAVKVGGLLLFVSTVGNLYLLLRHREIYRDAARVELMVQQQGTVIAMRQQLIDGLLREFGSRAKTDPGVAEIFNRYRVSTNTSAAAKP
jgi:hypothetical protein